MTKLRKNAHPSAAFDSKPDWPISTGVRRVEVLAVPTSVKRAGKKSAEKKERLDLYNIWTDVVKTCIDFQSLSLAREPGDLFHSCKYLLQADFGNPGHLLVTLYVLKADPKSPKKSHNDLRRARKIWLLPALETEKDVHGKETVVGINIVHATNHEFSVDPESAFLTIDLETDTVPALEELDRLFTKTARKIK